MSQPNRIAAILELCDELEKLLSLVRASVAATAARGLLDEQGSLSPSEAQARSQRDQKRTQRIQSINATAMAKANEVRASMGS